MGHVSEGTAHQLRIGSADKKAAAIGNLLGGSCRVKDHIANLAAVALCGFYYGPAGNINMGMVELARKAEIAAQVGAADEANIHARTQNSFDILKASAIL